MPVKLELNQAVVKKYIDLHLKLKLPFEMIVSNYTTQLKSDLHNIHFMRNAQSMRTFAAFQKVKSDCIKKPVPDVVPANVNYFATNIFNTDFYADLIYNIDLKAAYATVLRNDGYISKDTYTNLLKLPKMERLASVGMLAGKKSVFKIDSEGKPIENYDIISPTANYFFYCVNKTYEIMHDARCLLQESFLFSWVDGIYFLDRDKRNYDELMSFFDEVNFSVSFEHLKEFYVKNKKTYYACSYIKDNKKKIMNVPKQQNSIINFVSNYLLTKDY